jgi:hypothetical protein
MKDFENIGKRMPYTEREGYVQQLVDRATEQAISQKQKARRVSLRTKMAVAATVALLLAGAGITYRLAIQPTTTGVAETEVTASPVDDFLNSLSDEDAQLLAYYGIEEIPEYE